ncbi:MAG TPA: hypothetical protein VK453_17060 [Micromonosporaceae bacterium]|nr:hypothetical protein [Micromonosporaceae bacterium]
MSARTNEPADPPDDPVDLAEWTLHCYCPTARQTPHSVVAEGTNGRLLFEARAGVTPDALETRGVPVTEAQVARLVEFGLLDVDGGVLCTAFPVLGRGDVTALRQRLRSLGERLAGRLTPGTGALRRVLSEAGLERSAYAVVFGYALDELLWERLADVGAVPAVTLSEARPWWNGAFWAVHPGRDGAAGTNFVPCGGVTLVQVWTTATVARLNALTAAPGLRQAVRGLVGGGGTPADAGGAEDPVVDGTGVTWRLRRRDGRPALPVVGVDGPVDRIAGVLADTVAKALIGEEAATARAIAPGADAAIATVVVAHELIWEITAVLSRSGVIAVPPSLGAPHADTGPPVDLLYARVNRQDPI